MQPRPIFVLGIMQRSGTNYLWDLLAQHPDVVTRAPIFEDHLLQRADHLARYVDAVTAGWTDSWGVPPEEKDALLRSLGDGIVAFLNAKSDGARVVTKNPHVTNLELFPRLFPEADLAVVVRDGRNLVASGMRTFGWTHESATRRYAEAARTIVAFDDAHRGGDLRYRIVRYEDLVDRLEPTLLELLDAFGLDPSRYDVEAAKTLPVRGSSTLKAEGGDGTVHWQPVEKAEGFDPRRRYEDWTPYQRHRFALLAGEAQRALGYDSDDPGPTDAATWVKDRVSDAGWLARLARRKVFGLGGPDQAAR